MKYATLDEVRHHQKVTKGLVLSFIREVENAVDAFAGEEYDKGEIDKVSGLGEDTIQEAYDWLEDLDQAWNIIWSKEILVLEEIRKNVDHFRRTTTDVSMSSYNRLHHWLPSHRGGPWRFSRKSSCPLNSSKVCPNLCSQWMKFDISYWRNSETLPLCRGLGSRAGASCCSSTRRYSAPLRSTGECTETHQKGAGP